MLPRRFHKRAVGRRAAYAEVAKLGQRRWDEVPVHTGSQVRILPSALNSQDENLAQSVIVQKVRILPSAPISRTDDVGVLLELGQNS